MNKNCKNCGESVEHNYCSNCGQSIETGRINLHYLSHEIQHSVLHVDRGILYTIKELLIRPGHTIKNYLDGKRVNYFKPFAFVIILGTLYGFIAHFFNAYPESSLIPDDADIEAAEYNKMALEWIYGHYSVVMLTLTPIIALSSYLVFRKSIYNYFEHLIMYSYIVGIQILILLVGYIFYYNFSSVWFVVITSFLSLCYNVWVLIQIFSKGYWPKTMIRASVSLFLAFVLTLFVSTAIGVFFQLFYR
ncbi:MAG: DUF3667 domain-containing protein [Prevotella sp.]|jgi:hypothetical protein|nr:DUF3667 domain-containing protein [Prevotella sp.]